MKKTTLLFVLILIVSSAFAGHRSGKQSVEIISTRRDIFYFKVSHEFSGATVEVLAADGSILMTDTIHHTKSLIDFYFEQPGLYTIRMTKGSQQLVFTYEKISASPFLEIDTKEALTLN
jgi:hypothetical protein